MAPSWALSCDHSEGTLSINQLSSGDDDCMLLSVWLPGVQQTEEDYVAKTGLLHPYSMVTASRNNNQLESGFMNKWSIPRRPDFPRFSLFSWAHCWPWKEVI